MAVLDILHHPDPRLRHVAAPVEALDTAVRTLADDLLETMYSSRGIGLSAVQVGISRRVIVADVSPERNAPLALINPRVAEAHEEQVEREEGCLSVPGVYETVSRPARVRIEALDRDARPVLDRSRRSPCRMPSARDRSSRRPAVRRLPVAAQAAADPQTGDQAPARGPCLTVRRRSSSSRARRSSRFRRSRCWRRARTG